LTKNIIFTPHVVSRRDPAGETIDRLNRV